MYPIRIRIGLHGLACITLSKTVQNYLLESLASFFIVTVTTTSLFLGNWRVGIGHLRLGWPPDGVEPWWRGGNMWVTNLVRLHGFKKCTRLGKIGKHAVYLLR